jgi:hypothetical protein
LQFIPSNVDIGIIGISKALAKPFEKEVPILRPENDPGPIDKAI